MVLPARFRISAREEYEPVLRKLTVLWKIEKGVLCAGSA
jgi:hypothetical protein